MSPNQNLIACMILSMWVLMLLVSYVVGLLVSEIGLTISLISIVVVGYISVIVLINLLCILIKEKK
jgi:hypothetical protein